MRKALSGTMLTLLLTSMLILAFNIQPAKGVVGITIREDGSVHPPTAPIQRDGDIYTFTGDIGGVLVERDNIIIDGAGYRGGSIALNFRNNVTVKNVKIGHCEVTGIYLHNCCNCKLTNNAITTAGYWGIYLYNSSFNTLSSNTIIQSGSRGISTIHIGGSNNTLSGNIITNHVTYYARISINVLGYNNTLCDNTITNNGGVGIDVGESDTLFGNTITNSSYGITIDTPYNILFNNTITKQQKYGIFMDWNAHDNQVFGNTISDTGWYGIYLEGEYVEDVRDNLVYHNNLINNTVQAYSYKSLNVWDDGYPSGGNYWSDYTGIDLKSAPNQDQPGSDGIGDTSYTIDANNTDRYPLMNPWTPTPPTPDFSITASPTSLAIQQGNSDTSVVTITSVNGFDQRVQLTVSGAPSGVTATLSPEQVTPQPDGLITSTLTVSVSTTATDGTYTLTVTGTNGTLTHSVDVSLEITALPPPSEARVYVDPPVSHAAPGNTFSIDVMLQGVADLAGWEFQLYWDNSILKCITDVVHIPPGCNWEDPNNIKWGPGIEQDYSTTHGRFFKALTVTPLQEPHPIPFTGTTLLVTLTFNVKAQGSCTLDLQETKLSDYDVNPIPHTTEDGYFESGLVSARIDSYSISARNVTVGDDVTIGFSFTNTGDVSWTFGAGATLRKPGGMRFDFLKPVNVNPGELGSTQWAYTIDMAGRWDAVFGVWKESTHPLENLLDQTGWVPEYIIATAIENQPPVADIEPDLTYGISSGKQVTFDGSNSDDPDGTIVSYQWDFGDGETAEGRVVEHRFRGAMDQSRTYTVTLTVKDEKGSTDTDTAYVTVEPLEKTIEIGGETLLHLGFARMTTYYNWIGITEIDGQSEDIYIVSKIDFEGQGYISYVLSIWDSYSFSVGIPAWSRGLIYFGQPVEKNFVYPFDTRRDKTYTFDDGYFEGMAVGPSDVMRLWGFNVKIISGVAGPIYEGVSTSFDPGSIAEPEEEVPNVEFVNLASPGELRVHDSQGRVTGLANGEVKEEIPYSRYNNNTVFIFFLSDSCRYEVAGTREGLYNLTVTRIAEQKTNNFISTGIPTSANAIHQYAIDWDALSRGEEGVTVKVDFDGDGTFEKTFTDDSELTRNEFMLQVTPTEAFPVWIVGAAVATIAIATAAIAVFWRRRKQSLPQKQN